MGKKRKVRVRPRKTHKLTPSQWEEIHNRSMDGVTYSVLSKEYGIDEQTIKNRASRDKWAEDRKVFQHDMTQEMRQHFIESGLPPVRLARLIADSAKKTTKFQNIKKVVKPKGRKSYNLDQTVVVTDNDNTRLYREMVNKMIGGFAPPKASVKVENGNGHGPKRIEIQFIEVKSRKDVQRLKDED